MLAERSQRNLICAISRWHRRGAAFLNFSSNKSRLQRLGVELSLFLIQKLNNVCSEFGEALSILTNGVVQPSTRTTGFPWATS